MKQLCYYSYLLILFSSCQWIQKKENKMALAEKKMTYQCPMLQDSVLMDHPGECPKCGMNLVKIQEAGVAADVDLEDLLKPTNEFVVSNIKVSSLEKNSQDLVLESLGNIAYNTKYEGSIASRISGRIEKLYVRYRFQHINKGEKIMEIYSPEIMTAQQNLLFLMKNDALNNSLIDAAKNRLSLLGMDEKALSTLIKTEHPIANIIVYSNYNGHIHEAGIGTEMKKELGSMKDISLLTEELSLKEGMYVQKEKSIFSVLQPDKAWVVLNLFPEQVSLVKTGNLVDVYPETAPDKHFKASIDFMEPFIRKESKTQTVRIFFNNQGLEIPIGSQVKASIHVKTGSINWLPKDAILSLGMEKIVFKKESGGFRAKRITTGIQSKHQIQVISGLEATDSVASNAQYLMDSESFIKIK